MGIGRVFVLLLCALLPSLIESRRVFRDAGSGCPASVVEIEVGPDAGEIRSPLYPQRYPADSTCTWKLIAPAGDKINITSDYFSIENSMGCLFDYLVIYDGGSAGPGHRSDRFCGNSPFSIVTSSNQALLVFKSDSSYENIGFELLYMRTSDDPTPRIAREPACNGTFAISPGYITSPNYPLATGDNVYCTYTFTAPEGKVIQLFFSDFHVEPSTNCQHDSLEMFDGPDADSEWLDVYCGSGRPHAIRSKTNSLFLVFVTDAWYSGHGFNFTYIFIEPDADPLGLELADKDCSREVTQEGYVTSPNYPLLYRNNKVCVSVVRAPDDMYVKLVIEEFNLEDSDDCVFDELVIKDGESPDSPPIGSYCGKQIMSNTSITSTKDALRLEFRSDGSVSEPGFRIKFSFVTESDSIRCYLDCRNGGQCVQQSMGPICDCPPPYSGSRCETVPLDCGQEPCLNGGTCVQHPDSFSCFCLEGFTGDYCDELLELGPLRFKVAPQNKTNSPLDESVVLQCEVNRQDAKIQWVFNNDILLDTADSHTRRLGIDVHEGGVLQILRLTEDNSGKYTCVGDDGINQIEEHAWVTIDKPCLLDFTLSPKDTTETAGKKIHLFKCKATGGQQYVWEKDGQFIEEDHKFKLLVNDFLQVKNLEISDTGKYTCVVRDQTCVKRATAWLTVVGSGTVQQTCGRPMIAAPGGVQVGPRVTNGRRALEGSYPWFALLYDTVAPLSFCGATIINEKWIATAAHCILSISKWTNKVIFSKATTKIFVGSNHCRGTGGTKLSVDKVVVYPDYDNTTFNHDIALIKVKERIQFSPKIIPACLKPLSFIETRFLRGQESGYVAGCGLLAEYGRKPTYLSEVKLPIRNKFQCHDDPDSSTSAENMICAGYATPNRGDACTGDSGGGFVIKSANRFTLVGIVSWGRGCDRENSYGYYTNVGRYFKWIHDITGN